MLGSVWMQDKSDICVHQAWETVRLQGVVGKWDVDGVSENDEHLVDICTYRKGTYVEKES